MLLHMRAWIDSGYSDGDYHMPWLSATPSIVRVNGKESLCGVNK
jgi:hypothetical protein